MSGTGGRPSNPICPICVKQEVVPPRLRDAPGQPCKLHRTERNTQYSSRYQKRVRARVRAVRNHILLHELWMAGQLELAIAKVPQIQYDLSQINECDRDIVENTLTLQQQQAYQAACAWLDREDRRRQEEEDDWAALQRIVKPYQQKNDPTSTP
jgi:hypothetical protein